MLWVVEFGLLEKQFDKKKTRIGKFWGGEFGLLEKQFHKKNTRVGKLFRISKFFSRISKFVHFVGGGLDCWRSRMK